MAGNKNLNSAARAKKDEFYTQISDIENELIHYRPFFKGKTVLCNCDDPYESNFFKYFALLFDLLELKKLIATSYDGSPIAQQELFFESSKKPYKAVMTELKDWNGDGQTDLRDIQYYLKNNVEVLKGNGDFRSEECIELLKEADVVVTNPPFSLFREFVAQLIQYDKKFIIVGNQNAITYKEIFPLIMQNKIWLGYGFRGNVGFFKSTYEDTAKSSQYIEGLIRNSGVTWFTNVDLDKRHEDIFLYREYSPEKYPKYDNYDAIEVSKTADIPCDYDGVMGVPITFLDKYNPSQFEILGMTELHSPLSNGIGKSDRPYINGKRLYARILIRRKK